MTKYTAVVETGSCSMDYRRWETRTDCGHAHRTRDAAEKCLAKQQQWYCVHGSKSGSTCRDCCGYAASHNTSALWHNGNIHNQNNERA